MPTLATSRYVEIGVYIGQFFLPGGGELANEVRVPCLVAKGDRLFVVRNTEMRRSFKFEEQLSFSAISPHIANLEQISNGTKGSPVRLFTAEGNIITENKWEFVAGLTGKLDRIQLKDTEYSPSKIFFLDYQTTSRDLSDPIPSVRIHTLNVSAQIRQISAVGPYQDQQEYVEYVDFFGEYEVDLITANSSNANIGKGFSVVTPTATGTGAVTVSPAANYVHPYNRLYKLEVVAVSGTSPAREATLEWSSSPVSAGNSALPSTPMHAVLAKPTIVLDETDLLSMASQLLELGVVLDFDFGATHFAMGDVYHFQANGAGLIELDPLLHNTNQFTDFSLIQPSVSPSSTGSVAISSLPSAYAFSEYNVGFRIECISVAGTVGTRVASFVWSMFGMHSASGAFSVSELVSGSGVQPLGGTGLTLTLSFGSGNYIAGDRFSWTVSAPRKFYKGKESIRNLSITVSNVVAITDGANISGGYLTDTPEGRFGAWTATTTANYARAEIPDGIRFYIRNTHLSSMVGTGGSRVDVGDKFGTQARFLGNINFSLRQEVTDIISNPSELGTDVTGAITGTVGSRYITLQHKPSTILRLERISDDTPVNHVLIPGTSFIRILENTFGVSDGDLRIIYRWTGPEPEPGQSYFLSGRYLRPSEMYERPFLFLSKSDAETFLAPSTVRNDAYIGSQICWDYDIQGLFVILVRDADDDGVFTRDDYRRAINSFHEDARATDLVVLNNFGSLADQLSVVNRANDPFERHECLTYIGAPIGTPIGSENEVGSLVFFSRRTLQVYGQSPAHGSRIMVSPTKATRTITLDDGASTTVTLDGSYVAAALASLVASFADPRETVLRKTLTSFDTMDVYRKEENIILGGNNLIYFKSEGNGIYRIMEDITVDSYSSDTFNINQMCQKQFVTKDMRKTLERSIIGTVFPSATAGVATIQDVMVTRLRSHVTRSLIGQYQDDAGGVRTVNANDVIVFRDPADPTLFHVGYNYFLASVAKRIFGLYTVSLPGGFPK